MRQFSPRGMAFESYKEMKTETIFTRAFNADAPIQVDAIRIEWLEDESPDMSYLGEYSDTPEEHSIDRKERGDMGRNEYRYFNLGAGDADYIEQDYERYERLNRGEWCMLGCRAVAEVSYPVKSNPGSRRIERFTSGGLWGIESDSDKSYFAEVEQQELSDLQNHLEQFGIEWPMLTAEVK